MDSLGTRLIVFHPKFFHKMSSKRCLVFLCIVVSILLHVADCKFVLEFQFHNYHNEGSRDSDGDCCDYSWFSCGDCETVFEKLCLRNSGSSSCISGTTHSPGSLGGSEMIQFGSSIGSLGNPFEYTRNSIPDAGLDLYLRIMDEDTFFDDLIDEVIVSVPRTLQTVQSTSVAGQHNTVSLILTYTLKCASNYYSDDCNVYCIPQDDNTNGHYTCDSETGEKICREGWQNPASLCTEVACYLTCSTDGGTCSNGDCQCSNGWSGSNCDIPECAKDCNAEGGSCSTPGECTCFPTWTGANCDTEFCGVCDSKGGYCSNGICTCNDGYTGDGCDTDLDPCSHQTPCVNGNCTNDGIGGYTCSCPAGINGTQCETDINECQVNNPCLNNATCLNSIGSYSCDCDDGWNGTHCETNIDDCQDEPCQNGGNCTDLLNSHYCTCPVEYEGLNCELYVNACFPNPCENNATCTNLVTNYSCHCLEPYTGRDCNELVEVSSRETISVVATSIIAQSTVSVTGSRVNSKSSVRGSTETIARSSSITNTTPIIRPTSANIAAASASVILWPIVAVLLLMIMVVALLILLVLYQRRRAVKVSQLTMSPNGSHHMYSSTLTGSNQVTMKGVGSTDNPTYDAPKLKTLGILDDPLYPSTHIDTVTYAEPGPSIDTASSNIYAKPGAIKSGSPQYSTPYDIPTAGLHQSIDSENLYESIKSAGNAHSSVLIPSCYEKPLSVAALRDGDSVLNPLYQDTMPRALEMQDATAPGVNNPMYQETSLHRLNNHMYGNSDETENVLTVSSNPAYCSSLPQYVNDLGDDKLTVQGGLPLQYDYIHIDQKVALKTVPKYDYVQTSKK